MRPYKVIFLGTPEFAVPVLEKLIKDERFDVVAVVTEPDRRAGRGNKLAKSAVKQFIEDYKKNIYDDELIKIYQPTKIKNLKLKIKNLQPQLAVVVAYGQIILRDILEIPKHGFVNIHPSLLPKYRGPSPIQGAILNGDKKTGITIMKVDEKMDHGDVVAAQTYNLQLTTYNYQQLSKKLSKLGAKLLIKILPNYLEGKIKPKSQDHSKATYTKLLKKSDGEIDWSKSPQEIEREIRAYYPWPGTYTFFNGKRLKIIKAHLEKPTSATPEVEVGENNLRKLVLDQVQLEGKKTVSWNEFKHGYRQNIDISDKIMV